MTSRNVIDTRELRRALGSFTTGVTIITSRASDGSAVGLTANSFNSVSLDPPMVLWSLAKASRNLEAFDSAEHWAVHILSIEQEALSTRFARSAEDKFSGVELDAGVGNLPLLRGCTTRLQCRTSFKYEGGDHIIFVGEVLAFDRNEVAPLVFHAGSYAMAARKTPSPAPVGVSGFNDDFLYFLLPRVHYQTYARLRAVHESQGLDDSEFFVLSSLLKNGAATVQELGDVYGLSGNRLSESKLLALQERGLTRAAIEGEPPALVLTPAGHELTLHLLAAAQAIESEILATFSPWEVPAFKSQLRQLAEATAIAPAQS